MPTLKERPTLHYILETLTRKPMNLVSEPIKVGGFCKLGTFPD